MTTPNKMTTDNNNSLDSIDNAIYDMTAVMHDEISAHIEELYCDKLPELRANVLATFKAWHEVNMKAPKVITEDDIPMALLESIRKQAHEDAIDDLTANEVPRHVKADIIQEYTKTMTVDDVPIDLVDEITEPLQGQLDDISDILNA